VLPRCCDVYLQCLLQSLGGFILVYKRVLWNVQELTVVVLEDW
jgi:hypothetical protein